MKRERNHNIDLLKFLFSVVIVLHHTYDLVGKERSPFLGGSLAVEFFFIVSGYLMMSSIERIAQEHQGEKLLLGTETFQFIRKKLSAFYPEVLLAWFVSFFFNTWTSGERGLAMFNRLMYCFGEAFQLRYFGLSYRNVNGATWYLSSMLLAMAILYPLIRKYPDMMKHVVMPLAALLLWGGMCVVDNNTRNPELWMAVTYKGNIRALAELQLGAVCYCIVQHFRAVQLTKLGKVVFAAVEWLCYLIVMLYMYLEVKSNRDIIIIFIICLGVMLSFSGKEFQISGRAGEVCSWLGAYSFPLFLCHRAYSECLNNVLPESFNYGQRMAVYLLVSSATAFAVWGFSTLLRKNKNAICGFGTKLFIQQA